MATAPRPGTTPSSAKKRTALTITIKGESWTLNTADLGPEDDLIARKETGFPVSKFVDEETVGTDSVLILVWMARRKAGERKLRFRDVLREFPSYSDLQDIEVEVEEEEPEDDPLPSAAG